jgi:release factor glutamine methyltransferase
MTEIESSMAPLVLTLRLTEEQQRQILAQTGLKVPAVPFESEAAALTCRFGGVELRVVRGVFVPTPSTERLMRRALDVASEYDRPVIIDVGTGSGAVALAMAKALPKATVYATDISADALRCARENRDRLGLRNIEIELGSLLEPIPQRLRSGVTVIVANVPYLPPTMTEEARQVFPEGTAIGFGGDGLDLPRQLAASARDFLAPGSSLLMQLAVFQWPMFARDVVSLGYCEPQLEQRSEHGPIIGRITWNPSTEAL